MEREEYLQLRNGLYSEAEQLINEGKIEEGEVKMQEITDLDNRFDNEAKALANLNALKDNIKISNTFPVNTQNKIGEIADEDFSNTTEYRKAFMNYVIKGTSIPGEFKNSEKTKTTDVGAVIPQTVLSKIIEKMEATGMILPLVTRTSFKGGLTIPTSTVKPTATWVAEGEGSNTIKKTTGTITFAYHKLRCAIANTLEVDTMALQVFETTFINNVVEAMTKAIEKAIISGTGTNQPKGILTETVEVGQNIDIAAAAKLSYDILVKAEAALPLAYENEAVWFMTKKTFMGFVGLVDGAGQPIARTNYGLSGKPERILLGRKVISNDYMDSYADTVGADKIVAFLFNPKDYVLNTNLNMTIKRYEDNNTDDMVTKALMLVDGKVIDKNSLVTVTKKNA